jgi:hypothetical protein
VRGCQATTLLNDRDALARGKIDYSLDFFGHKMFLTPTAQVNRERERKRQKEDVCLTQSSRENKEGEREDIET